jgi:RNA polymerase sigma-70 factor (ECF subfamily)
MAEFEGLYRQYVDVVFRYATRLVGRRDVAEDITAEVFLALYRHPDAIGVDQFPAWLFTVAKRKAIDFWRHEEVERRHADTAEAPAHEWSPPLELWLAQVKSLKPTHRACVILRYVHGMERREIAERLGMSETQVKGLLQYALVLLRNSLSEARG